MPEDSSNAISPEQAAKLLKANQANLVKKITGGRTLSAQEAKMLEGIAEGGEAPEPEWAKNQTELAQVLKVTRQTIHLWRKMPGNPGVASNGRYNVAAWKAFAKGVGNENADECKLSQTQLKARQILLQNEKLAHQIAVLKSQYAPVEDVEKWGAELGMEIRKTVGQIHVIAPSIVGLTIAEAEMRLRELENEILTTLSQLVDVKERLQPAVEDEE